MAVSAETSCNPGIEPEPEPEPVAEHQTRTQRMSGVMAMQMSATGRMGHVTVLMKLSQAVILLAVTVGGGGGGAEQRWWTVTYSVSG